MSNQKIEINQELINECLKGNAIEEKPSMEKIKKLLEQQADVNYRDMFYLSPLIALCHQKYINLEILELLLKRGAKPNAENKMSPTPLHSRFAFGHVDSEPIKILLKHGLDPSRRCKKGRDVLQKYLENFYDAKTASVKKREREPFEIDTEIVKLFLEKGADPSGLKEYKDLVFATKDIKLSLILMLQHEFPTIPFEKDSCFYNFEKLLQTSEDLSQVWGKLGKEFLLINDKKWEPKFQFSEGEHKLSSELSESVKFNNESIISRILILPDKKVKEALSNIAPQSQKKSEFGA